MRFAVALFVAVLLAGSAPAADGKRDVRFLASDIAEHVIVPRILALDQAFGAQQKAWDAGCQSKTGLAAAYNAAADAWAQVEFFRGGPLSRQSRSERISFWPDPRNAIEKGLKALLTDTAPISEQAMADASVAVQGLPALERLLFTQDGPAADISPRACAAGQAIARNLATLAHATSAEWTDPKDGELKRLKDAADSATAGLEAATAILTDLATGLRIAEDRKMPPLFGAKGTPANPKAAEAWRSQRSERNLELNLAALADAFGVIEGYSPEAAAAARDKLITASEALGKSTPNGVNRAVSIVAGVNNARYWAVDVLPGEIGIALGFNSLDGD